MTGGTHEMSPAPPRPRGLARACSGPYTEFSTCFSDAPADSSPEVFATPGVNPSFALPEDGPYLVGGIITLDDAPFTTKIAVHSGAPRHWFPTDFHQTRRIGSHDLGGGMISVGAAFVACERKYPPRSWGGFGESAPP